jgi:hypothetical protein
VLCYWHKTKSHICLLRQSFMEWLNLEGIGDKKECFIPGLNVSFPGKMFHSRVATLLSNNFETYSTC